MTDERARALILVAFARMGMLAVHCGGHGLVVGCPVCGRRFP